jgi:hypothetical protein
MEIELLNTCLEEFLKVLSMYKLLDIEPHKIQLNSQEEVLPKLISAR